MKLAGTRLEHRDGTARLVGVVERSDSAGPLELFFSVPEEHASFLRDAADPFVPGLLIPSLWLGEDLEVVPPVSARLLRSLPRVQDILVSWHAPQFRRVAVSARGPTPPEGEPGTAVGALFSCGVDSFYTLLKSRQGLPQDAPPVTHLLYLKGFEATLDMARRTDETQRQVEAVAREAGKALIVCASNLRTCFTLNYEAYYHGAALCAAALALSRGLRYILVPSSNSYAQLHPWGSHPLLDERWSTERLEVVHDGAEANRVDKLRLVARDPLALKHLRVCLDNAGGPFNCGRCRKCVRTIATLDLLGALPAAETFPRCLPPGSEQVMRLDVDVEVAALVELARATGGQSETARLVERVARRIQRRQAMRALAENTPGLAAVLPWVDGARRGLRRALGAEGGRS